MAKAQMAKGAWADLAVPGGTLALRVTPNARNTTLTRDADGLLQCSVTAVAEDGEANRAIIVLLSHALGIARSRLTLIQGATAPDKVFRVE